MINRKCMLLGALHGTWYGTSLGTNNLKIHDILCLLLVYLYTSSNDWILLESGPNGNYIVFFDTCT